MVYAVVAPEWVEPLSSSGAFGARLTPLVNRDFVSCLEALVMTISLDSS